MSAALGQAVRMAFDWHMAHAPKSYTVDDLLDDMRETANKFYELINEAERKENAADFEAAQAAAAAQQPTFAPTAAQMAPQAVQGFAPHEGGTMENSSGLMSHDASQWQPTEIRCAACGGFTLVHNFAVQQQRAYGPEWECASRIRGKSPVTGQYETLSPCDYTNNWRKKGQENKFTPSTWAPGQ